MKGDIICHAVEVKEYVRILPNGKRVVVRGYTRQGNAAQDDMRRRMSNARDIYEYNRVRPAREMHADAQRVYQNGGADRSVLAYTYNRLNQARIDQEKAVRAERERIPTIADTVKYAATDAYEATKTVVGTIIEEAKFDAQVIGANIENAMPKVKEAVSNGIQAVRSFFSRLFGRR